MNNYTMDQMASLVEQLNYYTEKYDEGKPEISDEEWDRMYFKLIDMENVLGKLEQSPTQKIHFKKVSTLKKITHNHPMLSLDKTKSISEVISFASGHDTLAMAKVDGLTCSLTYKGGKLYSAETRGNGEIGEDITHNIFFVKNVPHRIPIEEEFIIDGEIICKLNDFEEFKNSYANPRNFASGSIRLLNSSECFKRKLSFVAWDCINGLEDCENLSEKMLKLDELGFLIVPQVRLPKEIIDVPHIEHLLILLKNSSADMNIPIDGLVFKYDNCAYYKALGYTDHHFRGGLAYKFADDEYETYLREIDWTMGRMGSLTPVAIYDDVDTGDSIINRASLHNLNILRQILKKPYYGQKIWIVKQNEIIPQVVRSEQPNTEVNYIDIPSICPYCGESTYIQDDLLYCSNPLCDCKLINRLDYFCGKKGLDIKGLSKKTLEKLIDWGWVSSVRDIFTLEQYRTEWEQKTGFGPVSVNNILTAIQETAQNVSLNKFIVSLGIPLVGNNVAKEICKHIDTYEDFRNLIMSNFNFMKWDGFGPEKAKSLLDYDYTDADYLYVNVLNVKPVEKAENIGNKLQGKTIVITGKLQQFKNRSLLQEAIINQGGAVSNSINKNTSLLINNDINSTSSKNIAAKKAGIPIITEADFIADYLT